MFYLFAGGSATACPRRPWLQVMDFAGSGVVHMVGGAVGEGGTDSLAVLHRGTGSAGTWWRGEGNWCWDWCWYCFHRVGHQCR